MKGAVIGGCGAHGACALGQWVWALGIIHIGRVVIAWRNSPWMERAATEDAGLGEMQRRMMAVAEKVGGDVDRYTTEPVGDAEIVRIKEKTAGRIGEFIGKVNSHINSISAIGNDIKRISDTNGRSRRIMNNVFSWTDEYDGGSEVDGAREALNMLREGANQFKGMSQQDLQNATTAMKMWFSNVLVHGIDYLDSIANLKRFVSGVRASEETKRDLLRRIEGLEREFEQYLSRGDKEVVCRKMVGEDGFISRRMLGCYTELKEMIEGSVGVVGRYYRVIEEGRQIVQGVRDEGVRERFGKLIGEAAPEILSIKRRLAEMLGSEQDLGVKGMIKRIEMGNPSNPQGETTNLRMSLKPWFYADDLKRKISSLGFIDLRAVEAKWLVFVEGILRHRQEIDSAVRGEGEAEWRELFQRIMRLGREAEESIRVQREAELQAFFERTSRIMREMDEMVRGKGKTSRRVFLEGITRLGHEIDSAVRAQRKGELRVLADGVWRIMIKIHEARDRQEEAGWPILFEEISRIMGEISEARNKQGEPLDAQAVLDIRNRVEETVRGLEEPLRSGLVEEMDRIDSEVRGWREALSAETVSDLRNKIDKAVDIWRSRLDPGVISSLGEPGNDRGYGLGLMVVAAVQLVGWRLGLAGRVGRAMGMVVQMAAPVVHGAFVIRDSYMMHKDMEHAILRNWMVIGCMVPLFGAAWDFVSMGGIGAEVGGQGVLAAMAVAMVCAQGLCGGDKPMSMAQVWGFVVGDALVVSAYVVRLMVPSVGRKYHIVPLAYVVLGVIVLAAALGGKRRIEKERDASGWQKTMSVVVPVVSAMVVGGGCIDLSAHSLSYVSRAASRSRRPAGSGK